MIGIHFHDITFISNVPVNDMKSLRGPFGHMFQHLKINSFDHDDKMPIPKT